MTWTTTKESTHYAPIKNATETIELDGDGKVVKTIITKPYSEPAPPEPTYSVEILQTARQMKDAIGTVDLLRDSQTLILREQRDQERDIRTLRANLLELKADQRQGDDPFWAIAMVIVGIGSFLFGLLAGATYL